MHENTTPFGSYMAGLMRKGLEPAGFEVMEVLPHPTPNKDFKNIVLKIKEMKPDLVIPSHYYNEGVLFLRTLQRQRVTPKAIYSVLGGASSQYRFLSEFPDAAQWVMDSNHWYNPKNPKALALRKRTEAAGKHYSYEVFLAYTAMASSPTASSAPVRRIGARSSRPWRRAPGTATSCLMVRPRLLTARTWPPNPSTCRSRAKRSKWWAPAEYMTKKAVFPRPA